MHRTTRPITNIAIKTSAKTEYIISANRNNIQGGIPIFWSRILKKRKKKKMKLSLFLISKILSQLQLHLILPVLLYLPV